ncbi:MAG TPA: site-specific integrase [Ktedonobacteraceae bacterium]|nr:site-specific integrase [Ktedonobacteraceae bacterium]
MGKRPGAKYAAVQRLNTLMADHQKRMTAKDEARARGESLFAFTDNKIHAFESRNNYQKIVMRFIDWVRDQHNIRDLARIDLEADELASLYLLERIERDYSAWTLATERSALRMFFQDRTLTDCVELPKRRREDITRSRWPAIRDKHINPENWQHVINFCLACGLRREELRDLRVHEVYPRPSDHRLVVCVRHGKGGKDRQVPVFPGREQAVLSQVTGRSPGEHVFTKISGNLDIHSYRREFAQQLYEHLSGKPLPPLTGRLQSANLDRDAALYVSRCLGHNRIDIIFGHYIR